MCKYAARPSSIKHIPMIVQKAVKMSMYGTPGPCYIDMPADIIFGQTDPNDIEYLPVVRPLPPLICRDMEIDAALGFLKQA